MYTKYKERENYLVLPSSCSTPPYTKLFHRAPKDSS